MYLVYADDNCIHTPDGGELGVVLINPVLTEKLNAHGSLEFGIAPSNPYYDKLEPRNTKIRVFDTISRRTWFGRVISMEQRWNSVYNVFCEGELGYLNDMVYIPFGFNGSPAQLLSEMLERYRGAGTKGYPFQVGHVSVTDPNNTIVRSSDTTTSIWEAMRDNLFESSLGGYVLPRYDKDTDTHYVDYLSLSEDDQFAKTSSQVVRFGQNLLNFVRSVSAENVITWLYPFGAQLNPGDPGYESGPPVNGSWNGNRVSIQPVNNNHRWIRSAAGVALWGTVVGTKIWDDVTVPANLLTKAQAWLDSQIYQNVSVEVSAVDLSFVDADIAQIQIGEYVRCISAPHDLNVLLLCTEKQTYLTELEKSAIMLGAGQKTLSDLQAQSQRKEVLL